MSEKNEELPYDLLLVGAGSASSLIASRISRQLPKHRILVLEAGQRARQAGGVVGAGAGSKVSGNRPRGRLIAGRHPRLELGPQVSWDLHGEVPHAVRQAALPG